MDDLEELALDDVVVDDDESVNQSHTELSAHNRSNTEYNNAGGGGGGGDQDDVRVDFATETKETKAIKEESNSDLVQSVEELLLSESIKLILNIREEKSRKCMVESLALEVNKAMALNQGDDYDENDDDQLDVGEDYLEHSAGKIKIPTIDLTGVDDENGNGGINSSRISDDKAKESAAKSNESKAPLPIEQISRLADSFIDDILTHKSSSSSAAHIAEELFEKAYQREMKPDNAVADGGGGGGEGETAASEKSFAKLVFDLVHELVEDLFVEKYSSPKALSEFMPNLKVHKKRQHFRASAKLAHQPGQVNLVIKEKLFDLLNLETEFNRLSQSKTTFKSKWRAKKRTDLVDGLLNNEMREQENDWSNYEYEENEAKLLISNLIFDMLIKDTIQCFEAIVT